MRDYRGSTCYRGGGGKGEHSTGLGNGSSHASSGLAVSLAEQLVRLRGKFLSAAGNALVRSLALQSSRYLASTPGCGNAPPAGANSALSAAVLARLAAASRSAAGARYLGRKPRNHNRR